MRTITKATEIDRLFKSGRRVSHPALLVLALPRPDADDGEGRVLFVAGKRLGSAVTRNRCKRVLREAARRAGAPWGGWDVALIARETTATATATVLDEGIVTALKTLRGPS